MTGTALSRAAVSAMSPAQSVPAAPVGAQGSGAAAAPAKHPKSRFALSGLASWYGRVLQGHRTASGSLFDANGFTACHRNLPFGTLVRVTNLVNRKSVIVRITDRGVLSADRIIDLSASAANALGMLRTGIAPVKLDVLTAMMENDQPSLNPSSMQ